MTSKSAMNNDSPRDWRDSVIIGSMSAGAILIAAILFARSQPQNVSISTTSTPTPPITSPQIQPIQQTVQQAPVNSVLPKMEAVGVINRYLDAKDRIFASPFDRQLASNLLTGNLYYDLTKSGGSIDWLQQNNAYYRYGFRKAEPLAHYVNNNNLAQIDVKITQQLSLYKNGGIAEDKNSIKDYRVTLLLENGSWKISEIQEK